MFLHSANFDKLLEAARIISRAAHSPQAKPSMYDLITKKITPDDVTQAKIDFREIVSSLTPEEKLDLTALFMLGRHDENCYSCAYKGAAALAEDPDLEWYLSAKGPIYDYLMEARKRFNSRELWGQSEYSCPVCLQEYQEEEERLREEYEERRRRMEYEERY